MNNTEDDTFAALKFPLTADELEFGRNAIVYCSQHLGPHHTGWCLVHNRFKIKLDAISLTDAIAKCKIKGYTLFERY